jgi:Zn-dependent peptidase ImmA (M78 family)
MSEYSYLRDDVKAKISKVAKKSLEDISAKHPPVKFEELYDHDKLRSNLYEKDRPEFQNLVKQIGLPNAEKLRGVLLVQDRRVIIVDEDYDRRNNFALYHEHGHWKLPWHQQMLYKCTQFDLSAKARQQMEREANLYASEIGFMGLTFTNYLLSSAPSISHIKELSDVFNMSMEATFRRAVELDVRPCAYLTLKINNEETERFFEVAYVVHSTPFKEQIGEFSTKNTFNREHPLAKIVTDPLHNLLNHYECTLRFGKKKIELKAEVWKNKWNIFALCQPT